MADERKFWKSTDDNPYYKIYGAEKLPSGLLLPERNIIELEDCARHRSKWQNCLKTLKEPSDNVMGRPHMCNDYFSKYKFCITMYKVVSSMSNW